MSDPIDTYASVQWVYTQSSKLFSPAMEVTWSDILECHSELVGVDEISYFDMNHE